MSKPETIKIDERFLKYVVPVPECGCHIWIGGSDARGYGKFWNGERYISSHRFAWERVNGSIPKDMLILHHCDIPSCVNEHHLYCGTHKNNTEDAINRNRFNYSDRVKGEEHGRAILTETQARHILQSKETTAILAKKYGVNFMTISAIRKNKSWKHIGRD